MAFQVNLEITNGIAKFALAGELDASTAAQFKEVIEKAAAANPRRLALLMNDLEFMASAGLRVLIFAKQKMGPPWIFTSSARRKPSRTHCKKPVSTTA